MATEKIVHMVATVMDTRPDASLLTVDFDHSLQRGVSRRIGPTVMHFRLAYTLL